jgi:quinol monooxygenase YgiN
MPILIKIRFDLKEGRRDDFVKNLKELMGVMLDHPGVILYHADYPEGENYCEFTELHDNDETFKAHLDNEKGKAPLGGCIDASSKIECRCYGNPSEESKEILVGFGATYPESAENSIICNPFVVN